MVNKLLEHGLQSVKSGSGIFHVSVNRKFRGKIPKGAPASVWAKFNGDFRTEEHDPASLALVIAEGRAITAVLNGYRKRDNFQSAQHLALDFDTEDSRSTLDAIQEHPFIEKYGAILHTSSSHTPEKPRARAIFILDEPITDADLYGQMASALVEKFGGADEHCKDPARLWFGTKDCEYRLLYNTLPMAVVRRELLEPYQVRLEGRRQAARQEWQGNTTPQLVEIAEALEYIPAQGDYDQWLKVLMSVHSVYPGQEGVAVCEAWSPGYDGEIEQKFRSFKREGVTKASLFDIAMRHGYQNGNHPGISPTEAGEDASPPRLEEEEYNPMSKPELGAKLRPGIAKLVKERAETIPCPDPELMQKITDILLAVDYPDKNKPSITTRRRQAGTLLLSWLSDNGEFLRNETDETYYLYRPDRKLFNIKSNLWAAWLYSLTGANPAGSDFTHFQADCETAAILADARPVVKVSSWDKDNQVLRVSRFDGTVYVLDGQHITEEANGENVLFEDSLFWKPYDPDFSHSGTFAHGADAYFDGDPDKHDGYRLALRAWYLASFFPELVPTRPLLVAVGEKGSGKSMTFRRIGRAMFGNNYELSGVPDKADGFTAAAAASHIMVIDNLDTYTGWLRDKLSRLSTGGVDEYRKLYSNNEVGIVRYRCFLAFTSRNPDTLQRDDIADRLVIIPVKRIPDKYLKPERYFLDATDQTRNAWWGDVLMILNEMVAMVRAGELQNTSTLRMADWESLGRLYAEKEGSREAWDKFTKDLKAAQSDLLLLDDAIKDAILKWLDERPKSHDTDIKSADLYRELTDLLYPDRKPPRDWPTSARGFGMRLSNIRDALKNIIKIEWTQQREGYYYRMAPK